MAKYFVLYNPLSNNKKGEESAHEIESAVENASFEFKSVLEVESFQKFFEELPSDVIPVLAGGDGTVNKFVNKMEGVALKRDLFYFPAGSGNDFYRDVCKDVNKKELVKLNPYIENLPKVTVNGETHLFINGIGYGIDGYCCEVGDELRKTSDKPINYAGIAIKGILFHFKSLTATVDVDGIKREFKNAWLAPTMKGHYYGGGMDAAPLQDRLDKDGKVSTMVFCGKSRLATLIRFPSIFKGEHVKYTKYVTVIPGYYVEVSFNRPCALQIDGETVLNVTSYKVHR